MVEFDNYDIRNKFTFVIKLKSNKANTSHFHNLMRMKKIIFLIKKALCCSVEREFNYFLNIF